MIKCPHCGKEIPGPACPHCGAMSPEGADYCMACGSSLLEHADSDDQLNPPIEEDDDLDLENRVLCPDGTCTGIIVDGKCTECGKEVEES